MWRPVERLLRSFSISELKDAFRGVNKRKLQQEIDVHKLYLFTTWLERLRESDGRLSETALEQITEHGMRIGFQKQLDAVQINIRKQVSHMSSVLHASLLDAGDPTLAAVHLHQLQHPPAVPEIKPYQGGSGLSMAPHATEYDTSPAAEVPKPPVLTLRQLSDVMLDKLGYTVSVAPSNVPHEEAGNGLFVQGKVLPGAVVALFPGITYFKKHYRQMPNYPKVDRGNPYLVARYDGGVLDSKPWGFGDTGAPDQQWPVATCSAAAQLKFLEGRHPLALAHFANHPGKGEVPNAMVASYTFRLEAEENVGMRAYIPCLDFDDSFPPDHLLTDTVHAVALVATTPLTDGQEILFNYRLSPGLGHPAWYVPLDGREEDRRWA